MSFRLSRGLPGGRKTQRSRKQERRIQVESLEPRTLLAVNLPSATGPITQLTVGTDGSFQVHHTPFTNGQVYPPDTAPGDAGIFLRLSDGTVHGLNLTNRLSAADATNSIGLRPISQTVSPNGQSVTTVMDTGSAQNPGQVQVTQVTSYTPGNDFFQVVNTLQNTSGTPITLDFFAAADIFLADSDAGVGFRNDATGAIGGTDVSGTYHIFIQPNVGCTGGLSPTNYEEAFYNDIWSVIGTNGANFSNTALLPTTSPPYTSDPAYQDNGAGLEWRSVTIAPNSSVKISYFWSFGAGINLNDAPLTAVQSNGLTQVENAALGTVPVATFTDADPNGMVCDYNASINWGDNSSTQSATITANPDHTFTVSGSHAYRGDEGLTFPVVVQVNDVLGSSLTINTTATLVDAPLTAQPLTVPAPSGTPLANAAVATFTDANPLGIPAEFTASIDWGDGTTSVGTIAKNNGLFEVRGDHAYSAAEGQMLPITVTIQDDGGSTAIAHSTADISDPGLTIQPVGATGNEGDTSPILVATFTDADPNGSAGQFVATIDWGDGSTPDTGTVAANGNGGFNVTGSHAYGEEGVKQVHVTVEDVGGAGAAVQSTATIADAPLSAQGATGDATVGNPLDNLTVATFTDADPNGVLTDYSATIDWGDGTTTVGTITPATQGSNSGPFLVSGSHTYGIQGSYTISTTILDNGGASTTASSPITVGTLTFSQPILGSPYFAVQGETPLVADVNGDGKPDLVTFTQQTAGSGISPVFVALGNGDGTFGQPFMADSYFAPAGETPQLADVNGDGKPDLVTFTQRPAGNSGGSPVFVALNLGNGTFGAPFMADASFSPLGEKPMLADLNGDGMTDLVSFSQQPLGSAISPVFAAFGRGDGTFGAPVLVDAYFAPASETPAIADLNGDGKPDLITFTQRPAGPGFSPSPVFRALNNGDGTFGPPQMISSYFAPKGERPFVADVSGDGRPDLVTLTQQTPGTPSPAFVSLQSTDGSFGPPLQISSYFAPRGETPAVADVNGDGRVDLVTFTQQAASSGFSPVFVALAQKPAASTKAASPSAKAAATVLAASGPGTRAQAGQHPRRAHSKLRASLLKMKRSIHQMAQVQAGGADSGSE